MRFNLSWAPRFLRQFLLDRKVKQNAKQVEMLTPHIRNNKHLGQILKATKPEYRHAVYEHLKPNLSFKAKPFFLLNR